MKNKFTISLLALVLILSSCCNKSAVNQINLNEGWQFTEYGKETWYSATVPGSVHTDLLRHGLIPDPMYRFNEDSLRRLEGLDWEYRRSFSLTKDQLSHGVCELVFDGLDTYAEVYLNDSLVLTADNMFIPRSEEVSSLLRIGENTLRVIFRSAFRRGLEKAAALPYKLQISNENNPDSLKTRPFTRKAPFHFGWDWGPRIVTCGIWRPVYLRMWDVFNVNQAYFRPDTINTKVANYTLQLTVTATEASKCQVQLALPEAGILAKQKFVLAKGENLLELPLTIENPKFWWPRGYGEAYLYKAAIEVESGGSVQKLEDKLGVRRVALIQTPDSIGHSFYFEINGVPVFAKGANYIPSRTITTEVTDSMYNRVINDAVKANMNMLRVWGGAIYENDIFYRLCDEKGIMVWQDFMFACEMNPGDAKHLDNIRKEAEFNVQRLRKHPSLVLWAGNNENLSAWHDWGWKNKYPVELSDSLFRVYEAIFHKILPDAVAKYQPELTYWGTSPGSFPGGTVKTNRRSGDEHDWNIWFGRVTPFENYELNVPRFVSEYGLQSYPELRTWSEVSVPEDVSDESPFFRYRQRSYMPWISEGFDGSDMIREYIRKYLGEPAGFGSYTYLSQVVQAIGLQMGIEIHRRNRPYTMGSLYWQLNDCWPTMSWATVDYYGRWKAAHYAVRKAFATVVISAKNSQKGMEIYVVSDSLSAIKGELIVLQSDFSGNDKTLQSIPLELPALSSVLVTTLPNNSATMARLVDIRLETNGKVLANQLATFGYLKDAKLNKANISLTLSADSVTTLVVKTDVFAPYVRLECIHDGWFSDNYFSLAPGTERIISFMPEKPGTAIRMEDFTAKSFMDFK